MHSNDFSVENVEHSRLRSQLSTKKRKKKKGLEEMWFPLCGPGSCGMQEPGNITFGSQDREFRNISD